MAPVSLLRLTAPTTPPRTQSLRRSSNEGGKPERGSGATIYHVSNEQVKQPGWWGTHWLKTVGTALTLLSIGATVTLAWRGAEETPTRGEVATFALLVAVFQIGAAAAFSRTGQVNLTHAGSSVRRLARLASRAASATASAERARERGRPVAEVREVMNQLSVELSVLEEGFVDAADDWLVSLPELRNHPHTTSTQEDSRLR